MNTIYLAGGCFWGIEGYFSKLEGIIDVVSGYANGKTNDTYYEQIKETDHAETVKIDYDPSKISLAEILLHYFRIIDPIAVNRQGNDRGRQYRTGVYYTDLKDLPTIERVFQEEEKKYGKLAVEKEPLDHFIVAEDYHQDYLEKNPMGYCHIDLNIAKKPLFDPFPIKSKEELDQILDEESKHVIFESGTERPFSSELNDEYRKGIYVDKLTGEPLFASQDKFNAGCGWPSFTKPILTGKIKELKDTSHGMIRTEVRSRYSDAHLGHVFEDGPKDQGGLRYCINGLSLRFIPYEKMDEEGYHEYKVFVH